MTTDRISDILTRLRNGYLAGNNYVGVPLTKRSLKFVEVLLSEGLISEARVITSKDRGVSGGRLRRDFLVLSLEYNISAKGTREPVVRGLDRESKPSLRRYIAYKDIAKLLKGSRKQYVLSTSFGTMNAALARSFKVGGEVLFSFRPSPERRGLLLHSGVLPGCDGVAFYVVDAPRWLARLVADFSRSLRQLGDPEVN
jgi:small subunit ribosomal protein S8